MKELGIVNWSTLPKSLIETIYSSLNNNNLKELRLINKHWSVCTNSRLFSNISYYKNKSELIEKYGKYIMKVDNNNFNENLLTLICENSHNITSLDWGLPLDLDIFINILNYSKNLRYLSLRYFERWRDVDELKLDKALDLILQKDNLLEIEMVLYDVTLLNLFLKLRYIPSKLSLYSYASSKDEVINKLKSAKDLKSISWFVLYPAKASNDFNNVPTYMPSDLLVNNNIEQLKLKLSYIDNQAPMAQYLSDSFMYLFNDPSFYNMKSLNWQISGLKLYNFAIFKTEIAQISNKYLNLRVINLMAMDKFLLNFIISNCPNLEELRFNSPLILPHKAHQTVSLIKLKKLLFIGYEKSILSNSSEIIRLFPNIKVVLMYCQNFDPGYILKNSPIFKSFPSAKLKFVPFHEFESHRCRFCSND